MSFLPVEIGPFRLLARLGTGGMGEVYRAVHTGRNFPVAVKIMNADRARDPELRSALYREIRAVARLHHPGIVMVFDRGEVDESTEAATDGRFVAGSSWFAMELASYSLEDLDRTTLDWWQVRNLFVRILDALSHSHARGVVHRDMKPGNVLFVEGPDGRHLKLTDFGLAHALGETPADDGLSDKITGTPRFMSPEQITGRWRDHGPWTDLYALGCVAYWLIEGHPPFRGDDPDRIMKSHLEESLPPLHADFGVPRGFGGWLGRLLAKDPTDRFQRAADAARALFKLGDPPGSARPGDHPRLQFEGPLDEEVAPGHNDTDMGMTEIISDVIAAPSVPDLQALEQRDQTSASSDLRDTVDIPQTWHRRQPPPLSTNLIGVGLGLFGLRQIPFVDRDTERDRLWGALRRVGHTDTPRLVLLKGPTGTGKSRLADWICERAHEVGSATPLEATHSPMGGASDGLGAMFAEHLRCSGLEREQIVDRVRSRLLDRELDPDALHDCLAVTEIIAPAVLDDYTEDQARVRFHRPEERYAAILRYLERLGRRRPLIVVADDLQWGNETLNTLEYLLEESDRFDLPLLVVGTVQSDALMDRPVARRKIDDLTDAAQTDTIDIGPLETSEHRRLINRMLGLDDQLVERVVDRTDGNPLYAVQLVGDWVERGLLEMGPDGFELSECAPAEIALPGDLREVFRDRLQKLVDAPLQGPPGDELAALELAAVIGTEVSTVEWSTLCSAQGRTVPTGLLEEMIANDLAAETADGFRFTHQAFRETILEVADDADRIVDHHAACAHTLADLYPPDHPELPLRRARHLIAADRRSESIEPLFEAIDNARVRCDFELADELYDHYESALDTLGAPPDDRRRIRGWLLWARTLHSRGDVDRAAELTDRAESAARSIDDDGLLAEALLRQSRLANHRGAPREGKNDTRESLRLYSRVDDLLGRGLALASLANLHYWTGDYHDSENCYLEAIRLFDRVDEPLHRAKTEQALGNLYAKLGEPQQARSMLEDARAVFDEFGDYDGVASCLNNLGEIDRQTGRLADAEQAYRQSRKLRSRVGLRDSVVVVFNLGLVRLARGRIDEADPLFEHAQKLLADSDRHGFVGLAHLARLPARAHHRDWQQWDHHLEAARRHLDETGFVDEDLAELARDAGQRALRLGQTDRARQALEIARRQWLQMGRQDRAADIDRLIAQT